MHNEQQQADIFAEAIRIAERQNARNATSGLLGYDDDRPGVG
jgi:hypothetical protein